MSSSCGSATTRTWNGIPSGRCASAASFHRSSAVQPRDDAEEKEDDFPEDGGGGGGIDPSQTRPLTEGESSNPHDHEAATRKLRVSAQRTSKTRRARRRRSKDGGSGGVRVRGRRGCGRGRREGERMIGDETILLVYIRSRYIACQPSRPVLDMTSGVANDRPAQPGMGLLTCS